jgi:hypothetical protein
MKTLAGLLFLTCSALLAGQDSSDLFDKAPPPIDEALRARVQQFYQSEMEGKFREAFALVADDSQDAFFAAPKQQYKTCETIRINYSEEFTKATVIEACEMELRFQGQVFHSKVPLTTTWKVVDGKWYWYWVKPKSVPSPFSPNGFSATPDAPGTNTAARPAIPADPAQAARGILAMVQVDKTAIHLLADQTSKDEVRVRNEMPGAVSLSIDPVKLPGLKITAGKTELQAKEETTVVFEYSGDEKQANPAPVTVQLHVQPTGQVFPIQVTFGSAPKEAASQP